MTIKEANDNIGRKIVVRHKISDELFTITLAKRLYGICYEQDNGECFVVTPVEIIKPNAPIWKLID